MRRGTKLVSARAPSVPTAAPRRLKRGAAGGATKRTTFEIPGKTVSAANVREHWAVRAKRARNERLSARTIAGLAAAELWGRMIREVGGGSVTLIRVSPRKLDSDNLARSLKSIRDGIADALRINDGDDLVRWHYVQTKGPAKSARVVVSIATD